MSDLQEQIAEVFVELLQKKVCRATEDGSDCLFPQGDFISCAKCHAGFVTALIRTEVEGMENPCLWSISEGWKRCHQEVLKKLR